MNTTNTISQKLREIADLFDQLRLEQGQQNVEQAPQNVVEKWGPYFNSNQSISLYESVISGVTDCLKVAEKYRGKAFGGYVRNVVVPRLFGDNTVIGYKDVDVWFHTEEEANSFITDMGDRMKNIREFCGSIYDQALYPFARTQYVLIGQSGDSDGIVFDIIVSETLPVNDLNVNQLTYSPTNGLKSYGKESIFELTSAIIRKEAYMLKEYPLSTLTDSLLCIQFKRLNKLIDGGWVIIDQTGEKYIKDRRRCIR